MIASGGLIEWAEYLGHLYGTPREPLEKAAEAGRIVLLDIDVQGARQVMKELPDAITVFIDPPGGEVSVLQERLASRGTDSPRQRSRRIEMARIEFEQRDQAFDKLLHARYLVEKLTQEWTWAS